MPATKIRYASALLLTIALPLPLAACAAGSGGSGSSTSSSAEAVHERSVHDEETNRQLVLDFYDQFFNKHQTEKAAEVVADDYIQHNPQVPNGKDPFVSYFTGYFAENPDARMEVVRSATDGNLVFLHVKSTNGSDGKDSAVVDIFRVEDNMIVEHWDVIQDVPVTAANSNTMF